MFRFSASSGCTPQNTGRLGVLVALTLLCLLLPRTSEAQTGLDTSKDNGETPDAPPSASADDTSPAAADQLDLSLLLDPEIEGASLVEEPLSEAPAPVTVITSDMIDAIGARNLKEVLTAYVPGMTEIEDRNEKNVALRGIYTSSQQKILVLLNGHRLNSRVFSSAAPDFSIGIAPAKIKHIEVIRGPGSAVYGNLALNGVINIVTKDPDELDGGVAEAGIGNFGQRTAQGTYGKQLTDNSSILLWGSYFRSDGQKADLSSGEVYNKFVDEEPTAYLMGHKKPPSFDVGGIYEMGDFSFTADVRQGNYAPPYTSSANAGGQTYEYDEFRTWNGIGPGLTSQNTHLELSYNTDLTQNITVSSSLYMDYNETYQYVIIQPRTSVGTLLSWRERTFGNISQVSFSYDLQALGSGTLAVGGQIDAMNTLDAFWLVGREGDFTAVRDEKSEPVLPLGNEQIYSGFTQLKHKLGYNRDIILNLGVRYDYKDRHEGDSVDAVSPRTAIIFGPDSQFGAKFSYSESFVDAPYWYRYNRAPNFRGAADLQPERMQAFQLAPTLRLLENRLRSTTNFYYATHSDIIFRKRTLDPEEALYQNSGELTVSGVEEEVAYLQNDYRIRGNLTYQLPVRHERYPVDGAEIHNVPKLFGNLVLDVKPLWWIRDNVWLSLHGQYYSGQLSPVEVRFVSASRGATEETEYFQPQNTVDPRLLLRSSLRWKRILDTGFQLQFTVDNILNTRHYQGGTTPHPYRQPGRWYLLELGYRI